MRYPWCSPLLHLLFMHRKTDLLTSKSNRNEKDREQFRSNRWLCILGAAPFAAMGFVKYHGMMAEKFFIAWLRSEFLVPKRLTFRPTNLYWEAMQEQRRQEKKRSAINFGAFAPKLIAEHGTKRRRSKKC